MIETRDILAKMEHIQVADGLHWVAIPEADLYILCGCPGDSVKHLMKKGLIVATEKGGIQYETGPNAILLSDVLIQRGSFGNLSEFPVLQMLYLQGMILPDHPNNTGIRPLLIGAEDKVSAQLKYIYRGNYGLISEEEIIESGIDPEQAHQMMRLKLKFAFGEIRPTEDLLDGLVVGSQPTEIRNGVIIERRGMNIYELRYKDEAVTVDLNLPPASTYTLPYSVDYRQIDRNYFSIIHSGDGDGWDMNRASMGSVLMFKGKYYLVDAGPHIGLILQALGISINEIKGVFHTHAHDDHFAGLSTLAYSEHRLKYYSTPVVRVSVQKKLAVLAGISEDEFTHLFDVIDLEYEQWNDIDTLEVKPIISPHPVENNIFLFRASLDGEHRTYAHLADIVSMEVLKGMVTEDENEIGIRREYYDEILEKYLIPANLKKIDIGGGLIHGDAEDFRDDRSDRIALSHTAKQLTDQQKSIGARPDFGSVDVLISSEEDFNRQLAEEYLEKYFPEASGEELRELLQGAITTFEPGAVLVEPYMVNEDIYLILGGNVEVIHPGVHNILSSGAMIGELSGVMDEKVKETYQAVGYVSALRIPTEQYINFIQGSGLLEQTQQLFYKRRLLKSTDLFGESLSYPLQTKLASVMTEQRCEEGHLFAREDLECICMISFGVVELWVDDIKLETLIAGDIFHEEAVLTGVPGKIQARADSEVEIYRFPANILVDIPIVRWKLFELHKRRNDILLNL